jgi:MoaA/NifB/PqqE/SkfB family radical SAM enzyme
MSARDYSKVLDKLLTDIPFLYLIDLYHFGEPTLNPELPEIIRMNWEHGVASGISTNLNAGKNLEEIIKAEPGILRVAVSGFGEKSYEITHTGGKWNVFLENLLRAKEYIKKYNVDTIIELMWHTNKLNLYEYRDMWEFCKEHDLRLTPYISIVLFDNVLDYLEGKELSEGAKMAKDIMLIDLDEILRTARAENAKPCLQKYAIPVIGYDMSVMTCCSYVGRKLADNYLDVSIDDIIKLRNASPLCDKCVQHSLHRYPESKIYRGLLEKLLFDANGVVNN